MRYFSDDLERIHIMFQFFNEGTLQVYVLLKITSSYDSIFQNFAQIMDLKIILSVYRVQSLKLRNENSTFMICFRPFVFWEICL